MLEQFKVNYTYSAQQNEVKSNSSFSPLWAIYRFNISTKQIHPSDEQQQNSGAWKESFCDGCFMHGMKPQDL